VPANSRIAIFGDWGTGMPEAAAILQQIKGFNPDVLLHLGDVYYSGTVQEVQERFQSVVGSVFGTSVPRRFSLSGNHDMYSGGAGYYALVDQLEQQASYFAVQNDDWLFIGMDTGKHDFNPLAVSSTATILEQSEADWVNGLITGTQAQKVVLFSHHPLFSAYEAIAGDTVNHLLLSQLAPSLGKVTAWFWGHEHRLGVYDEFQGLRRGRCLGHAAVPVFADATGDPPKFLGVPVLLIGGAPLDPGSANGLFKHGFAIMELSGKQATVSYYREGEPSALWAETF
jgi:3',5'-cyclic AMP phosphodiesterase CpdA